MGNSNSTGNQLTNTQSSAPVEITSTSSGQEQPSTSQWKCPFNPKNYSAKATEDMAAKCPVAKNKATITSSEASKPDAVSESKCPVNISYKNPNQYNVYNQKIDPKNQMPVNPNQMPAPNQAVKLSTERVKSQIPKGGTDDDTWTYPSPQMFWNAIVRKNKVEGVQEHDIDVVVSIHNNMNETTWKQILAWEAIHTTNNEIGKEPKLLRFMGRPHDLSPKAILKTWFGHPSPFDRHDWIVDRGGQEVRYVIDYYHDESGTSADQRPKGLTDAHSIQSIKIDVRPALDSLQSLFDRVIRMPYLQIAGNTSYKPPPFFAPQKMIQAEEEKINLLKSKWQDIQSNCQGAKDKLKACATEQECGAASIALQRCTAKIVCPEVVLEFDKCVHAKSQDVSKLTESLTVMEKCLDMFRIESEQVLRK